MNADIYLNLGVGNVFVLLGRRISGAIQGFRAMFLRATLIQSSLQELEYSCPSAISKQLTHVSNKNSLNRTTWQGVLCVPLLAPLEWV